MQKTRDEYFSRLVNTKTSETEINRYLPRVVNNHIIHFRLGLLQQYHKLITGFYTNTLSIVKRCSDSEYITFSDFYVISSCTLMCFVCLNNS